MPSDDGVIEQSCPACDDEGFRDYMVDKFAPDSGVSVTTAVCENRDCRVREFYVPREDYDDAE